MSKLSARPTDEAGKLFCWRVRAEGARRGKKASKGYPSLATILGPQIEEALVIQLLAAQPVVDNLSTQVLNCIPAWLLFTLSPKAQGPHIREHITGFNNICGRGCNVPEAVFKSIP